MEKFSTEDVQSVMTMLAETWKGTIVSAGMKAGLFSLMSQGAAVSEADLAIKTGFDPEKIDKWLYYAQLAGFVLKKDGGYIVSSKTEVFMEHSPLKDIVGFVEVQEFFMNAAINSKETFQKGKSLDKLSEGKITRLYQPKVSDNFSKAMLDIFLKYKMQQGDSLLDIGSGAGSFLRALCDNIQGLQLTGFDYNLFAIETAKKENKRLGYSDRIRMLVGDAATDLVEYKEKSYDWVTAINIFHFFPKNQRQNLIEQMLRISRKGIFYTQILIDNSVLSAASDPLMALLWNDFTGFFRNHESEDMNYLMQKQHTDFTMVKYPILQGAGALIAMVRNRYAVEMK